MSACICILGVAWLGDTFVSNNIDWIKDTAGEVIQGLSLIHIFLRGAGQLHHAAHATHAAHTASSA